MRTLIQSLPYLISSRTAFRISSGPSTILPSAVQRQKVSDMSRAKGLDRTGDDAAGVLGCDGVDVPAAAGDREIVPGAGHARTQVDALCTPAHEQASVFSRASAEGS